MSSYTVQFVYDRVCNRLLENGGLQLGLLTNAQFLIYFQEVLKDFLQRTGLSKIIVTQTVFAGTTTYTIPDQQLETEEAFLDGYYLQRSNVSQLDNALFQWPKLMDTPDRWHQDGLPIKTIELVPNPVLTGVIYPVPLYKTGDWFVGDGNLTTVAAQIPTQASFALGDPIPLVPDTAVPYLTWGVLRRFWSDDSENKDELRGGYAAARYEEGINLFKSALLEELADDYEEVAS